MTNLFFSIIIPAHNEEKYIVKTIEAVKNLDYLEKNYEVIIIENGSSDKTYEVIKKFKSKNFKIYSLKKKGVSRARNFGASKSSKECKWLVFLDADTILREKFLKELSTFLEKDKNKVIGTAIVHPDKKNLKAKFWFWTYNSGHRLFGSSAWIQIAKKECFLKIKYDESLNFSEDLKLIRQLSKFGRFFILKTDQVETSTRRFERMGYLKIFLKWMYGAFLMDKIKRSKDYDVIR